jgi:nicotinate-nucleotide pyrophosphorylase (carboxylating)
MGRPLDLKNILPLLIASLREDGAWEDRTTKAVIPPSLIAKGEVVAKSPGILAGLPVMAEVFRILDKKCQLIPLVKEGQKVHPGQRVAWLKGPARGLLSGERVALNLMSRLSGIATLTRKMRQALGSPRLFDTRKTTPLWRALERYAVKVGGGRNHRFNLSGHVLLKDNHLKLGGGVFNTVTAARNKYGAGETIEVEIETFEEASEALRAGADIILIDNAAPALFRKIHRLLKGKAVLETSGGIDLRNIRKRSRLPVDRYSSGSLTHSAPAIDFSIELFLL